MGRASVSLVKLLSFLQLSTGAQESHSTRTASSPCRLTLVMFVSTVILLEILVTLSVVAVPSHLMQPCCEPKLKKKKKQTH